MNSQQYRIILIIFVTGFFLYSCHPDYTPKPRGFFRIDLPEKKYQAYSSSSCPFSFEYPVYSNMVYDASPASQPCWMNIEFPSFKAKIHLSYKSVNGNLSDYINDARILAYKHTVKADAIEEIDVETPSQAYGVLYRIRGNAASGIQFYLTDSMYHFIRGALYFSVAPQSDSLAPVHRFIEQDITRFFETFQFKR